MAGLALCCFQTEDLVIIHELKCIGFCKNLYEYFKRGGFYMQAKFYKLMV